MFGEQLTKLRNLTPPPGDETTVRRFLATRSRGLDLARDITTTLAMGEHKFNRGNLRKLSALSTQQRRVFAKERRIAQGYGFKVCGSAPPRPLK